MARPLRICYPGAVYHVTARGNERRPIVRDDEDRQRFVRTIAGMVEEYEVLCHAWVLMDNHYHLVMETPHANLSQAIRHLNGVYTQAFNRRHARVGHLFQGRFSGILVDKQDYLLQVCRYVVLNPVRAGLVDSPSDWLWSSYRATSGEAACPSWLTVNWLLGHFGTRRASAQAAYRHFVGDQAAREVRIWSQLRGRAVLGSEAFLEEVRLRIGPQEDDPEVSPLVPPGRRTDGRRPTLEVVLGRVADAYGVSVEHLLEPAARPSEARQVAIFGARRIAHLAVRTIGARFGLGSAAVSKRLSAVAHRLEEDPELRARVNAIMETERPDPVGRKDLTPICARTP